MATFGKWLTIDERSTSRAKLCSINQHNEPPAPRQACRQLLVLICFSTIFGATPVFGQEGVEKASWDIQSKSWFERITAQYRAASVRAETLLAKARASVANSRNIHARAVLSTNDNIKARARKALLNAEALQKKAQAELSASRSTLAVLRGGPPKSTIGTALVFCVHGPGRALYAQQQRPNGSNGILRHCPG